MITYEGFMEKTCAACGKIFYIHPGYVYKREMTEGGHHQTRYFCKYTCMTAHDRTIEARKATHRAKRKKPDAATSGV